MGSEGNAFELQHDPVLEEMSITAIKTFLEARRRYQKIIDDKMSTSLVPRRFTSHHSSQRSLLVQYL